MEKSNRNRGNGYALSRNMTARLISVESCRPLGRETKKHPPQQILKLVKSLEDFGFVLPILVDAEFRVVAGWALVLAAQKLGLNEVPAVQISDLPESKLRLLRLALNRIAEDSSWDPEALSLEFSEILQTDPNIEIKSSGFEVGETDSILSGNGADEEDDLPVVEGKSAPTSRLGDLWVLKEHRILCGDALQRETYSSLLDPSKAEMVFADPPYNVPIDGHVSGLGAIKHAEFTMASGELSQAEFITFLKTSLGFAATYSTNGAIHFVCMDWRHQHEILAAGNAVYSKLENLCVWNKSNAGMGSLYRSKHELIFVFKVGDGAHINNVLLGRHGRNRTNVWDYVSQNALNGSNKSKLQLHPTVKPVAMIADAIRDCSNRGGIILDPFGGAGTTLIAAERTGRRARAIEIDPTFVDVSIQRWQHLTGKPALLFETGQSFADVGVARRTLEE
jgi:DNA modification methylase